MPKHYQPVDVLEIRPDTCPGLLQIRTQVGWSVHGDFKARLMIEEGKSFYEDSQVEEGGSLLRLRYLFSPQQIEQLKEYV